MAMNKARRTANLNNILTYDTLGNSTLIANLTVEGLTGAGFVKADAAGLLSVDTAAYTVVTGVTNYLTKITAPNTLGQSLVYDNGTSVYINTAVGVPGYSHAFQVMANGAGGLVVSTTDVASAIGIVNSSSANKTWDISPFGNHLVINESGVATRMKFDAGGNITIGDITNTGHKLEVVGSFRTTGTNTLSALQGVGDRMVVANTNGVLTTQPIPTGSITGTGAAGQVNFWTGTNTVSGSNNLFWDAVNNRLGIGIATPAVSLDVRTSAVGELAYFANTAANSGLIIGTQTNVGYISSVSSLSALGFGINGTTTAIRIFTNSNVSINNNVDLGVRFSVVGDTRLIGSGATSATTALTVQNSGSINMIQVLNNGYIRVGSTARFYSSSVASGGDVDLAGELFTINSRNFNTPTNQQNGDVLFNGVTILDTSGIHNGVSLSRSFTPTSGTSIFNHLALNTVINQTGGANGITRGLYVNPTLTAAADWRSIEWSNNSGWGLYGAGTANNYMAGSLSIGNTTVSTFGDGGITLGSTTNGKSLVITSSIPGNNGLIQFIDNLASNAFQIAASPSNVSLFGYGSRPMVFWTNSAERMRLDASGNLGIGITPTVRLHVSGDTILRGSGNTNTTTALTVQNSASATMMSISNDAANTILNISGSTNSSFQANQTTANRTAYFGSVGTDAQFGVGTAIATYTFINGGGFGLLRLNTNTLTTTGGNVMDLPVINTPFNPTSGSATLTLLQMRPNINQTGGANGVTRGLYVNPILTSAADFRAIEWSNNSGWGLYGAGTANNLLNGRLYIPAGSYDLPSLSFVNDTNTGLFSPLVDNLELKTGTNNAVILENQGINLMQYSENLGTFPTNFQQVSVSIPGNVAAPDGTLTANIAVPDTSLNQHRFYRIYSTAFPFTMSVYAKAAGYNFISFGWGGGVQGETIIFDLANGTVSGSAASHTATIENVGNGWFRCSLSYTAIGASTSFSRWIIVRNANSTANYSGDGTSGVYVWGWQIEENTASTSYTKTGANSVTRPQAISLLGENLYGNAITRRVTGPSLTDLSFATSFTDRMTIHATSGNVMINSSSDLGQRLQVIGDTLLRGSGNTSATTALTVQNSDTTNLFRITNNGVATFGSTGSTNISSAELSTGAVSTGALSRAILFSTENGNGIGYQFYFRNSITGGNTFQTSGAHGAIQINSGFAPTIGTAQFNTLLIANTINQTGGANGITRGLYVNPTLTAAADWRSVEWSNNTGWGLYGDGTAPNLIKGNLIIGPSALSQVAADSSLHIGRTMNAQTSYGATIRFESQSSAIAVHGLNIQLSTQDAVYTTSNVYGVSILATIKGTSNTITNQYGFFVSSTFTAATNNYAYWSDIPTGANRWNLYMNGTANNYLAGSLGVGSNALTGYGFRNTRALTGSSISINNGAEGQIQTDVSVAAYYYRTISNQIVGASTTSIIHYGATQGTLSGVSNNQYGFYAFDLSVSTANYGFYGALTSGANKWNLFMNGTANNYMNGALLLGNTTTDGANKLQVTGSSALNGVTYVNTNASIAGYGHSLQVLANASGGMIVSTTNTASAIGIVNSSSSNKTWDISPFNNDLSFNESGVGTRMYLSAGGRIGLGIAPVTLDNATVTIGGNVTTGTGPTALLISPTVQSTATSSAVYSLVRSSTQAASFVLPSLYYYFTSEGTFGAGSSVTSQYGYYANGNMTGATNNYGFYGAIPAGTGRWNLYMNGDAHNYLAGNVGIGSGGTSDLVKLYIVGSTTGTTIYNFAYAQPQINTSLSSGLFVFRSNVSGTGTASTTDSITHFIAQQSSLGSATVTNQYGFRVDTNLTSATNNYGFYGNIASAANRWNLYMAGTALNHLNGTTLIGTATDDGINKLQVAGSISATADSVINGVTIGKGGGSGALNTAVGSLALSANTTGASNTAFGLGALATITTGSDNVAVGTNAGRYRNGTTSNIDSSGGVYIGNASRASATATTNEIVIGAGAQGNGDNTVTIGNTGIVSTTLRGNVTTNGSITSSITQTATASSVSISLLGSNITSYAAGFSMVNLGYGLNAMYAQHEQRFGGNATFAHGNLNGAGLLINKLAPTAAGTVTITQQSGQLRTMSNLHLMTQFEGNNNLTVTDMSGLHIYGHYRTSGTGTLTVSNAYYGIFLADPNEFGTGATITGTNWGFYQQGTAPINAFQGSMLVGTTTTDANNRLVVSGNTRVTGNTTSAQFRLSALNTAPATSTSTGTTGEIVIDANHIYVCTATNTWKRVAIATF